MDGLPTVGHLVRRYRSRTESFIGAQIATLNRYRPVILCERRAPESFEPDVATHAVSEMLDGSAHHVERFAYRVGRRLTSRGAAVVAAAARVEDVRVLHGHYLVDARFFLSVRRRLPHVPMVVSAYGYDVSSFPRRMFGYGRRYLQPLWGGVDMVLAMSQDMRRDLVQLGCPPERIAVHYHGVPVPRFETPGRQYAQRAPLNVLVCGTLEIKKGQDRVLLALRRLQTNSADVPPFRLTLVGDGPLRPHLERLVRDFGWRDCVSFRGHIPHDDAALVTAYREADVFVLPSEIIRGDKEGVPGTIAEAMAAGLPVVATRHAGIPELVEHERSGLLVEERDGDALATALGHVLRSPELRARLGQAAVARVRAVGDLEARTRDLECLYDSLIHVRH